MDSNENIAMLEHWVGTYLVRATLSHDPEKINEQRKGLISKLNDLSDEPSIRQCITFLKSNPWYSSKEVNAFRDWYEKLNT